MRKLSKEEMYNLVFVTIISADNPEYTEERKQEVISRYDEYKDKQDKDWKYIMEPVDSTGRLQELFK